MRTIVEMHHRIGVASRLLSPDETLRRLPILTGGEPVAGAVVHDDDAIVHHDAVVWAHLEHLAADERPGRAEHHGPGDRPRRPGRGGGRHRPRADRDAGRAQRDRRLVDRAQRAGRRLRPEPAGPPRGAGDRAAPPHDRGGGHVLPPDRGLVQPDAPGRDRDGRRRSRRTGRREPGFVVGVPPPDRDAHDAQGPSPRRRGGHPPMGRDVRRVARPPAARRSDHPARRLVAGERLERPGNAARPVPDGAARRAIRDGRVAGPAGDVRSGPVRPRRAGRDVDRRLLRALRHAVGGSGTRR